MIDTLEAADRLAEERHKGQVDKAGGPYVEHPRAVARITAAWGGSLEQQLAALLHDIVEDTDCTLEDLRRLGVPEPVLVLVDALSRRPGESLEDYLGRVVRVPGAVLVKRADLAHNSDPDRLARLAPKERARLERKYARVRQILDEAAERPDGSG